MHFTILSTIERAFPPGLVILQERYCIAEAQEESSFYRCGEHNTTLIDIDIREVESIGVRVFQTSRENDACLFETICQNRVLLVVVILM